MNAPCCRTKDRTLPIDWGRRGSRKYLAVQPSLARRTSGAGQGTGAQVSFETAIGPAPAGPPPAVWARRKSWWGFVFVCIREVERPAFPPRVFDPLNRFQYWPRVQVEELSRDLVQQRGGRISPILEVEETEPLFGVVIMNTGTSFRS